ncbi:MAG: hypothetical protein E7321_10975 [Clostridiales bacterium]|nr:hypothetical protein [Clostridiales bacterium]
MYVHPSSSPCKADTKEGIATMRNRITKRFAMLAILCVLIMALAAPALAASYSKVYGQTQDRIRVRASASASGTIIDNIVKGACVYVTESKTSSGNTYLKVNYRNSDGNISSGWVRLGDGNETYVKILSADQAQKTFSVKSGNLPSKKVGTFTAAQRNAAGTSASTSSSSSSDSNTIKSVQTMLKALKYYTGDITGNVGDKTKAAIKQFQREYHLSVDGVAGPQTIAKLESVYNDKGGSSVSTSSSSSSGTSLRLGSTGTKVRNLQQDLTTLGYYWADITGNFGSKTQSAVKNFQEKNKLTADGIAGTKTLNAIAAAISRNGGSSSSGSSYTSGTTLKLNSQGPAVTQLQTDLKQLGYYYADITGNFGSKTEAAVKDFQQAKKLTADGVAGSKTLDAISKAISNAGGSISDGSSLKVGSTGDKVRQLQQDLTALGYYYGDISGHYGNLTKTAVSKFQKAKGITQDGIAGATTLNAIAKALGGSSSSSSSSLREGDESSAVLELQTMLKELGYYYGDLTGSFGSLTKRAVRQFQDDNDLTVDGIAGTKTMNLLRSMTGRTASDSVGTGTVTSSSVADKDSYFEINQDGVRLRSTYSLTSAAKTTMNKGKAVKATRKYIVAGTTWYYITVKNSSGTYQGYVRAKVLDKITKAEYDGSGDSVTDTGSAEILGMIRITANNVAIRESNSSSSTAMGHANKGDVFFYMDKEGSWYQIQSGYWIKDTYADKLDDDEVDDYFDNGSYAGGSYREGDTGAMVLWIQEALTDLGYYKNDLSGHYGSKTKEAVRKFQKDHNLSADGIAGPKTIAKLMEEVNEDTTSSGSSSADKEKTVYNISWSKMKSEKLITNSLTLTDIKKGLSFDVKVQSTGNHADVEPKTANDTKVLCSLYGAANAAQLESENMYQRRAVIVTNSAGQQFIGSIYAIPHGQDTVSGNNFDGQFCLHFLESTIHEGGGSISESENHQAKIKQAAKDLKAAGYTVSETYP